MYLTGPGTGYDGYSRSSASAVCAAAPLALRARVVVAAEKDFLIPFYTCIKVVRAERM